MDATRSETTGVTATEPDSDEAETSDGESSEAVSMAPGRSPQELADSLKKAACEGNAKEVAVVLEAKADPNHRYAHGLTALHFASLHNRPEAVRALMAGGADSALKSTDEAKCTAWELAVVEENEQVLEALLEEPQVPDPIRRRFLGPCLVSAFVFLNLAIVFLLLDDETRWHGWQQPFRSDASSAAAWHRDVAMALSLCCLTCLVLVNSLDPGAVCRAEVDYVHRLRQLPAEMLVNIDQHKFGVIHDDGTQDEFRWCVTCKLWRPENVSHCSECRRCFWRFDHHCMAVGTCIAAGNHRVFAPMLLSGCSAWAVGIHGVAQRLHDCGAFSSWEPWQGLDIAAQWPLVLAALFVAAGSFGCAMLSAFAAFHTASMFFAFNTKICWTRPRAAWWPPECQSGSELMKLWLGPVRWRSCCPCDPDSQLRPLDERDGGQFRREIRYADMARSAGPAGLQPESQKGLLST